MQSISRAIATSSRSISRSTALRSISRLPSRFQQLAKPTFQSRQSLSAAFVQRRLYSDEVATTQSNPIGHAYNANETLYIGNLFFDTTPDQLKAYFSTWGEVTGVRIPTDIRGFVRGYGFVTFSNLDEADRARGSANGQVFHGRRLVVGFSGRRRAPESTPAEKEPTSTLFVGNLSYTMTDKDLNDLFRPLRKICDVRVAIDRRTGQPRGFAHADFMDVESATAAKTILNGKVVQGRELKTDYAATRERPSPKKPLADLIAEEQTFKVEVNDPEIVEAVESAEGPIEIDSTVTASDVVPETEAAEAEKEQKSQAA